MNPLIDKTLRLTIICGIAALLLGFINYKTEPIIQERKIRELQEALSALVDGASVSQGEVVEDHPMVNMVYSSLTGTRALYILEMTAQGYGGDMKILAVYNSSGELQNAKLMDNTETVGIGKRAEGEHYMVKFLYFGDSEPIPTSKAMINQDTDDITGATITFNGIAQALSAGSDWIKGRNY